MPIDFESFPLREIRKGRTLAWDPHGIDFSQDARDWLTLTEREQEALLSQVVGFLIGERSVTHDLAPVQQTLRRERKRMEEEMYVTQQLFEEATHVEFFQRWLDEALPGKLGEAVPFPELRGNFFSEILPNAMQALEHDRSPAAQMRAIVTYHQIVEGVLAELGYELFYACLDARGIMPGLRQGLRFIQQDESRHIAFGTYLAQRLISEHPDLAEVFEREMEALHENAVMSPVPFFDRYGEHAPFGLDRRYFLDHAETLYQRRRQAVLKGGLVQA